MGIDGLRNQRFDVGRLCHVRQDESGICPLCFGESDGFISVSNVHVTYNCFSAFFGKFQSGSTANSGSCSCDEGNFSGHQSS